MRTSQYLLSTIKEVPTNTEVISHQLMIRAGMIRQLSSGLYNWLPTGLRVLRKVENIVREEMNNSGAMEVSMTIVQPSILWQESGRLVEYGPELLQFKDRTARSFVLGPTHEEAIINLIRNEVISYKQLPLIFYQIQTKFRDEIRPRFGIMRSREFLMKDAYSFHTSQASMKVTYDFMYQVYSTIFTRMGLKFCTVQADNGLIGGNSSHEFHVLANNGEDNIVLSTTSNYAVTISLAEAKNLVTIIPEPAEDMRIVYTHNIYSIIDLMNKFSLPLEKIVKTLLVRAHKDTGHSFIALIIRGDHLINQGKVEKLPQVDLPLTYASEREIYLTVGVASNWIGPVNLTLPIIIDSSVAVMSDFVAGANINGQYFFGINWKRDLPLPQIADLRKVADGDISPDGTGQLRVKKGIEVGHIFQLGTKYSEIMKATVQDQNGYHQTLIMGCYGIGISRVVAAAIEQHHDDKGIVWPQALAPFHVSILPINLYKSFLVRETAENLYHQLQDRGIDVLFDDRKERLGVMLTDMDLIGIPHQIIIGERNLEKKEIEYKNRLSNDKYLIKINDIVNFLTRKIFFTK